MDRANYNHCISEGFKSHKKDLEKYPQPFKFCSIAKLCSEKAKNIQEAIVICSQPKEPKVKKPKKVSAKTCKNEVTELTYCIVNKIDMNLAKSSLEKALMSALMECKCNVEKRLN